MIRTYDDLIRNETFIERYRYLRLRGVVGDKTFGYDRYLNQILYTSKRWIRVRDEVVSRDNGRDLGIKNNEIQGIIIVHHMNPITIEDVERNRDIVYDPKFLISTSLNTHNAIHYGDESLLPKPFIKRSRNDTCPWLKGE
jgi:hypothetical protein